MLSSVTVMRAPPGPAAGATAGTPPGRALPGATAGGAPGAPAAAPPAGALAAPPSAPGVARPPRPATSGVIVSRCMLLRHTDIWCCWFFPDRDAPQCCTDQDTRLDRIVSSPDRTGRIDKSCRRRRAILSLSPPVQEMAALAFPRSRLLRC